MKTKLTTFALFLCCAFIFAACNSNSHKKNDPSNLPPALQKVINQKYPGATLQDYDKDAAGYEVNIMDKKRHKEVLFSAAGQWLSTKWDVKPDEVPPVIMDNLTNSAYADYKIKEIDGVERPTGMYYVFELEHDNNDVHLTFTADGQPVK